MKIIYKGETKKVSDIKDYNLLIQRLAQLFSFDASQMKQNGLKLYYQDEENDIISLTNQGDLDEAFEYILGNQCLKLVLAQNPQDAEQYFLNLNSEKSEMLNQSMRSASYSQQNEKPVNPIGYGQFSGIGQAAHADLEFMLKHQTRGSSFLDQNINRQFQFQNNPQYFGYTNHMIPLQRPDIVQSQDLEFQKKMLEQFAQQKMELFKQQMMIEMMQSQMKQQQMLIQSQFQNSQVASQFSTRLSQEILRSPILFQQDDFQNQEIKANQSIDLQNEQNITMSNPENQKQQKQDQLNTLMENIFEKTKIEQSSACKCKSSGESTNEKNCEQCEKIKKLNIDKNLSIDEDLQLYCSQQIKKMFDKHLKESTEQKAAKKPKKKDEIKIQHIGVQCNKCQASPIEGIRYKCSVRPNYDLCEKCEKKEDSAYPLIKIKECQAQLNEIFEKNSKKSEKVKPAKVNSRAKNIQFEEIKVQKKLTKKESDKIQKNPFEQNLQMFQPVYKSKIGFKAQKITVQPSQYFSVEFTYQNIGEQEWPENVKLEKINGDDIEFTGEVILKQLKPNETCSQEIFMRAPQMINQYFATFKLSFGFKEAFKQEFGEKAILNIDVKKQHQIKNLDFQSDLIDLEEEVKQQKNLQQNQVYQNTDVYQKFQKLMSFENEDLKNSIQCENEKLIPQISFPKNNHNLELDNKNVQKIEMQNQNSEKQISDSEFAKNLQNQIDLEEKMKSQNQDKKLIIIPSQLQKAKDQYKFKIETINYNIDYKKNLQNLMEMGFLNFEQNLKTLGEVCNNLGAACQKLIDK